MRPRTFQHICRDSFIDLRVGNSNPEKLQLVITHAWAPLRITTKISQLGQFLLFFKKRQVFRNNSFFRNMALRANTNPDLVTLQAFQAALHNYSQYFVFYGVGYHDVNYRYYKSDKRALFVRTGHGKQRHQTAKSGNMRSKLFDNNISVRWLKIRNFIFGRI